jgi:hypothetical protein
MELAWALTAGAVNDPDDIQIVSGGASAGQQFLSVRDTDSDVNGGNLALSFADVDVSQASSVTVSVDILVGVGTWNTTDFVAFGFAVGGNNHTLVEIVGLDMDTVEGAGWMTFSTTVDTLGADWITDIQFEFRGAHAGDDVALDQLIFTADLIEEPPMDDPPMDDPPMDDPPSSEIPEPATGLVWLILAGLGAGSWCRRLRRPRTLTGLDHGLVPFRPLLATFVREVSQKHKEGWQLLTKCCR